MLRLHLVLLLFLPAKVFPDAFVVRHIAAADSNLFGRPHLEAALLLPRRLPCSGGPALCHKPNVK
jgi:hypothetical protein